MLAQVWPTRVWPAARVWLAARVWPAQVVLAQVVLAQVVLAQVVLAQASRAARVSPTVPLLVRAQPLVEALLGPQAWLLAVVAAAHLWLAVALRLDWSGLATARLACLVPQVGQRFRRVAVALPVPVDHYPVQLARLVLARPGAASPLPAWMVRQLQQGRWWQLGLVAELPHSRDEQDWSGCGLGCW